MPHLSADNVKERLRAHLRGDDGHITRIRAVYPTEKRRSKAFLHLGDALRSLAMGAGVVVVVGIGGFTALSGGSKQLAKELGLGSNPPSRVTLTQGMNHGHRLRLVSGHGVRLINVDESHFARLPRAQMMQLRYAIASLSPQQFGNQGARGEVAQVANVAQALITAGGVAPIVANPSQGGKEALIFFSKRRLLQAIQGPHRPAQADYELGKSIAQVMQAWHGHLHLGQWGYAMTDAYAAIRLFSLDHDRHERRAVLDSAIRGAQSGMRRKSLRYVEKHWHALVKTIQANKGKGELAAWYAAAREATEKSCGPRPHQPKHSAKEDMPGSSTSVLQEM